MSRKGEKFAGCRHCFDNGNITWGDTDGREFEQRVTRTGSDSGSMTVTYDEDGDPDNDGDPSFDGDWEEDDSEYDYSDISCTYCGNDVGYGNTIVILWSDDDSESISLYEGQDDDDYESDDESEEEDASVPTFSLNRIVIDTGKTLNVSIITEPDAPADTPEVQIVFGP